MLDAKVQDFWGLRISATAVGVDVSGHTAKTMSASDVVDLIAILTEAGEFTKSAREARR